MATVYSYARFSHPSQMTGDSLRRQKKKCRDWMEAHPEHQLSKQVFRDLGISSKRGRNYHTGALRSFLDKIEDGEIKPGSILLVEALDRISREGVMEAMEPFGKILKAGVDIVALVPTERHYSKKSCNELPVLMEAMMGFYQAALYSQLLSDREKEQWEGRRKQAIYTGGQCPKWFYPVVTKEYKVRGKEVKEYRLDFKPGAKETIEYIFQRTIDGVGQRAICHELNRKKIPTFGRSKHWNPTYVQQIIHNRAVIGCFKPCILDEDGNRVEVGEEIKDFYPRAIDDDLFYSARPRGKKKVGRPAMRDNLFTTLMFGSDGYAVHMHSNKNKARTRIQHRLVSWGHLRRLTGSCPYSLDYWKFEKYVLLSLLHLKPEDLLPKKNKKNNELQVKQAALLGMQKSQTDLEKELANWKKDRTPILNAISSLIDQKEAMIKEIDRLQVKRATALAKPLENLKPIIEMIGEKPEYRLKLRALIAALVKRIDVDMYKDGYFTHAKITISFNHWALKIDLDTRKIKANEADGELWHDSKIKKIEITKELKRRAKTGYYYEVDRNKQIPIVEDTKHELVKKVKRQNK